MFVVWNIFFKVLNVEQYDWTKSRIFFPPEKTYLAKTQRRGSLTAKSFNTVLCHMVEKKSESLPAARVSESVTGKLGLHVTEKVYTIDGESHLIIFCLPPRRWIRTSRAALPSLNRKLSGTSGMTAQAVWRQQQILPWRIGNYCSKRSWSKCTHNQDKLVTSSLRQTLRVPFCRHLAHFTVCVTHTSREAIKCSFERNNPN